MIDVRAAPDIPEGGENTIPPFTETLSSHGLFLTRRKAATLQVNVGLVCNLACRHCHHEAGPDRAEVMAPHTMERVAYVAAARKFHTVDLTGGAPELAPGLEKLIETLAGRVPRVILRSNLAVLCDGSHTRLLDLLARNGVVVVASLPSTATSQTDAQRGRGAMARSIEALRMLNGRGYGMPGTGLVLELVSNPAGAFLPGSQPSLEKKFKSDLGGKYGIAFNSLYVFANSPLGRFGRWLMASGNYAGYLQDLAGKFNACATEGLMCRELVSVAWDGALYDCDFNMAAGLSAGGRKKDIWRDEDFPVEGDPIATGDHCYACTAGTGFT